MKNRKGKELRESYPLSYLSGVYAGTVGVASLAGTYYGGKYSAELGVSKDLGGLLGIPVFALGLLTLHKGLEYLKEEKDIIVSQDRALNTIAGRFFGTALGTATLEGLAIAYFMN